MNEKIEKGASPKVAIPYNTSLKKSEKLRAPATGHSVREWYTFGKKVAILDERVENWKNRCAKSDGVLSPALIADCPIIEVKRRVHFGNCPIIAVKRRLAGAAYSKHAVKR